MPKLNTNGKWKQNIANTKNDIYEDVYIPDTYITDIVGTTQIEFLSNNNIVVVVVVYRKRML